MEARIEREEQRTAVYISGRLDTVTSAELKSRLEAEWAGEEDLLLDFTEVEYISSAGLRLLVALQKSQTAAGHTLTIRNINQVVREIFRVAGFNKALTIV